MTDSLVLAHHWLFEPRGGERVLAELAALFLRAARRCPPLWPLLPLLIKQPSVARRDVFWWAGCGG